MDRLPLADGWSARHCAGLGAFQLGHRGGYRVAITDPTAEISLTLYALQFRTLLQEINLEKQLIEQSRRVIANHHTNIERLTVDLELAVNTLTMLRAEYDPATLDGSLPHCGQTLVQPHACAL
jgi:hypothetical protein